MIQTLNKTPALVESNKRNDPAQPRRSWVFVFLACWSFLVLCNSGYDESEGSAHFFLAQHFISTGDLGFSQKGLWGGYMPAPNGKFYCSHEIGNTLFALPTAAVTTTAGYVLAPYITPSVLHRLLGFIMSFQAGLYIAATITIFFCMLRSTFALTHRRSLLACALLLLTTPLLGYDRILYDGILCGLMITAGFFLLTQHKTSAKKVQLALAFAAFGFAVITRLTAVLAVLSAFVYLLSNTSRSWKARLNNVAWAVLALVPFALWQCWYNHLRTGFFWKPPILAINPSSTDPLACTWGLLASPGKGLFVYAPLLLLSVVALPAMRKRWPAEFNFVALLALGWIFVHGHLDSWYGAWCWGPRYCVTIIPILFLPFALQCDRFVAARNMAVRAGSVALIAWGMAVNLASIVIDFGFRLTYLEATGVSLDQLIWGGSHNQMIDAVTAAGGNIARMFTHAPLVTLSGTALPESAWSMPIQYASSTINVWPNLLLYIGAKPWLVALVVAPFVALLLYSLRRLRLTVPSQN